MKKIFFVVVVILAEFSFALINYHLLIKLSFSFSHTISFPCPVFCMLWLVNGITINWTSVLFQHIIHIFYFFLLNEEEEIINIMKIVFLCFACRGGPLYFFSIYLLIIEIRPPNKEEMRREVNKLIQIDFNYEKERGRRICIIT